MKGKGFLKVTSILMIIGGIIAAIAGIIAILGVGALSAIAGTVDGMGLLYASLALVIVASIIEFIAGIKGVGACSAPAKAASCVKWGIVIVVLSIVSMILNLVGGGKFNVLDLVLNLAVPVLYVLGAVQMKNGLAEQNAQGA